MCNVNHRLVAMRACMSVVLCIGFLIRATDRGLARSVNTQIEIGGFLGLYDSAKMENGDILGVSGNGIIQFDGNVWKTVKVFRDGTRLTAIASDGQTAWATGSSCDVVRIEQERVEKFSLGEGCAMNDIVVSHNRQFEILVGTNLDGTGVVLSFMDGAMKTIYSRKETTLLSVDESKGGDFVVGGIGVVLFVRPGSTTTYSEEWQACNINVVRIGGDGIPHIGGFCVEGERGPDEIDHPLAATYEEGRWKRQVVEGRGRSIVDISIDEMNGGWAAGDGAIIYKLTEGKWKIAYDYGGSVFSYYFNSIVKTNDGIMFAGSPVIVIYSNNMFRLYLGNRMGNGEIAGEVGLLSRISIRADGTGFAVGRGGPPIIRSASEHTWHVVDGLPMANDIVSVATTSNGQVWFGTFARSNLDPVFIGLSQAGDIEVLHDITDLSIVDIDFKDDFSGWAVSSTHGLASSGSANQRSNIEHYEEGTWHKVCDIAGEELVAIATISDSESVAVGSGIFLCDDHGVVKRLTGTAEFATNVFYDGMDQVYVTVTNGAYRVGLSDGVRERIVSTDEIALSIAEQNGCMVLTGLRHVWVGSGTAFESKEIPVASDNIGPFVFRDGAVDHSGDMVKYVSSGEWNTIVAIDLDCESIEGTPASATTTPESMPTSLASATPSGSATPSNVLREILFLPMAYH